MSNRRSNFPNNQPIDVKPGEMAAMIERMTELQKLPRVTEANEVRKRIEYMFQRCIEEDVKQGVEIDGFITWSYKTDIARLAERGFRARGNNHAC